MCGGGRGSEGGRRGWGRGRRGSGNGARRVPLINKIQMRGLISSDAVYFWRVTHLVGICHVKQSKVGCHSQNPPFFSDKTHQKKVDSYKT